MSHELKSHGESFKSFTLPLSKELFIFGHSLHYELVFWIPKVTRFASNCQQIDLLPTFLERASQAVTLTCLYTRDLILEFLTQRSTRACRK